jgi:hypothetical protein
VVTLRTLKEEVYLVKKEIVTASQHLYGKARKDESGMPVLEDEDKRYLQALEAKKDLILAHMRELAIKETANDKR